MCRTCWRRVPFDMRKLNRSLYRSVRLSSGDNLATIFYGRQLNRNAKACISYVNKGIKNGKPKPKHNKID